MVDDAKKIFLAGIGAVAMTYEKASEVIDSLVNKGKLTIDEGTELAEELKRNVKVTATDAKDMVIDTVEKMKPITKDELVQILNDMNYATKADVLELKRKIEKIEQKDS